MVPHHLTVCPNPPSCVRWRRPFAPLSRGSGPPSQSRACFETGCAHQLSRSAEGPVVRRGPPVRAKGGRRPAQRSLDAGNGGRGARHLGPRAEAVPAFVVRSDAHLSPRRLGPRDGLTTAEQEELALLRRENRALREVRDILKRATASGPLSVVWAWLWKTRVLRHSPARGARRPIPSSSPRASWPPTSSFDVDARPVHPTGPSRESAAGLLHGIGLSDASGQPPPA